LVKRGVVGKVLGAVVISNNIKDIFKSNEDDQKVKAKFVATFNLLYYLSFAQVNVLMNQEYFLTQNLIALFEREFKPEIFDNDILVVGLGGNGTHIALAAVRMGFRRVVGIDKDFVSETNLSRQVLYTTRDLGCSKADSAHKSLSSHNLVSDIETHDFDILDNREKFGRIVEKSSIVFIALDQPAATFFAIDTCYKLGKPAILGGTCTMSGLATRFCWMAPQQRPCLNCLFPNDPSLIKWFNFYKFNNDKTKQKSQEIEAVDNLFLLEGGHPSIYPTASIGSNLMMAIALNYFMGRRDMPRVLELSILNFTFLKQEIITRDNCPTCSSSLK
jgi:molybdopterin/thiamine biosynthesis adenylyltransferase